MASVQPEQGYMSNHREYRSYLLRLYQAHSAGRIVWRASLEDPHTGTRLGFSSIGRLYEFLLDQTDDAQNRVDTCSAEGVPFPALHDDPL
jgi:hypothetical protein